MTLLLVNLLIKISYNVQEMCENQLSKLITLKNVGDFLQFSQLYLAQQLEVSAVQPTFFGRWGSVKLFTRIRIRGPIPLTNGSGSGSNSGSDSFL